MISKPTVNLTGAGMAVFLAGLDETHAHARGLAGHLAGEPLGAGPATETRVVIGGRFARRITMRAPAVAVFGSREFGAAALLRAAGKSPRIIRADTPLYRVENIATADLVAEKMSRYKSIARAISSL